MREIFRLFFCLIWIFVCLIEMDISSSLSPSLSPPQTPTKNGGGPSNGEVQLQVRSRNILDHFCRLSLVITLSTILRPREKKITLATILITNFLKCHIKGGGRPGGGEVQDQAGLRRPQRCL